MQLIWGMTSLNKRESSSPRGARLVPLQMMAASSELGCDLGSVRRLLAHKLMDTFNQIQDQSMRSSAEKTKAAPRQQCNSRPRICHQLICVHPSFAAAAAAEHWRCPGMTIIMVIQLRSCLGRYLLFGGQRCFNKALGTPTTWRGCLKVGSQKCYSSNWWAIWGPADRWRCARVQREVISDWRSDGTGCIECQLDTIASVSKLSARAFVVARTRVKIISIPIELELAMTSDTVSVTHTTDSIR